MLFSMRYSLHGLGAFFGFRYPKSEFCFDDSATDIK